MYVYVYKYTMLYIYWPFLYDSMYVLLKCVYPPMNGQVPEIWGFLNASNNNNNENNI